MAENSVLFVFLAVKGRKTIEEPFPCLVHGEKNEQDRSWERVGGRK
jgi:hypothetical protein